MMATGWLISSDTLVTAGHVAYDHTYNFGPAIKIMCYIGYNGADSVNNPAAQVQTRFGKRVVTTVEWLDNQSRLRDLAFIRLQSPFQGTAAELRYFQFQNTDESGAATLYVVGYPGDKLLKRLKKDEDEQGAQMYEGSNTIKWDITKSKDNMIEYNPDEISTAGGRFSFPARRKH